MRPARIRVEGFSAYRKPVEVDFDDVDFFSLTGPTGSGKSSLIDAMIFALYGRVPRLGGNAVAPAITAGSDRARVAFEFDVGEDRYTAVRLAQRTATGGASVKEARLLLGDEVVASGADQVSTAVEDLLKLRFDDFTRTVVLPQGDFARFLTATKAERQGLLRSLLGLDVYTTVRELARTRAAVSTDRAESAERALAALEVPDDETAATARQRLETLDELSAGFGDLEKALAELRRIADQASTDEAHLRGSVERLQSITAPDRLEALDALTSDARERAETAEERLETARQQIEQIESALEVLPSPDQLTSWDRHHARLAEIDARLADLDQPEIAEAATVAEARVGESTALLLQIRDDLNSARQRHAAHALVGTLVAGEACPVCTQVVERLPGEAALPELDALEEAERAAAVSVDEARRALDDARSVLTRHETAREEVGRQRESVMVDLENVPSPDELAQLSEKVSEFQTQMSRAREALEARTAEVKAARRALEDLAEESRRIGRKLTEAQLRVADLEPELSESDDVIVQWKDLLRWRTARLEDMEPQLEIARTAVENAEMAAERAEKGLAALLESHEIPAVEPYAVQLASALHVARTMVELHEKAVADSVELARTKEEATKDAAVATTLMGHLRSNGFEQWLMAGALVDLVQGANDLLSQLSNGGYSLASDYSGDFSIVDHRNADEQRSVSTLSGGETFLVSLALALSLAETLAAKSGSGLDAIILDEGFGTLDDDSLDTVASVLEELTGRGLMVGVITHVKELAARAPVRYVVTREPTGATVRLAP